MAHRFFAVGGNNKYYVNGRHPAPGYSHGHQTVKVQTEDHREVNVTAGDLVKTRERKKSSRTRTAILALRRMIFGR